jgi:hypothetical protein
MVRTVRQSAVTQSGQITTAARADRPLRRDKNKPTRLSKGLIACYSGMCRCFSARRSRISSDLPTVKSASASLRGDCRRSRRKSHRGNAALVEREAMTPFGFELAEVVPLQSRWQVIQYSPRAIQANLVEDHRQILADCLAREYAGLERETQ